MRQGVAGHDTPETHVVERGLGHAEAGLHIAQALPERELGKRQAVELVPAGEALDLVVAAIPVNADTELVRRHGVHQLGEDRSAAVHESTPLAPRRAYDPWKVDGSNR